MPAHQAVGDKPFTDLDCADNVVLLVEQATQFADVPDAVEKESAKLGLHISWRKQKYKISVGVRMLMMYLSMDTT